MRSWHDGWRHPRFLLMFNPRWLFLIPGSVAFSVGLLATIALVFGPLEIGRVGLDVSSQVYLAALTVVLYQPVLFALLTKLYTRHEGFHLPRSRAFERSAEGASPGSGAIVGLTLFVLGLGVAILQLDT